MCTLPYNFDPSALVYIIIGFQWHTFVHFRMRTVVAERLLKCNHWFTGSDHMLWGDWDANDIMWSCHHRLFWYTEIVRPLQNTSVVRRMRQWRKQMDDCDYSEITWLDIQVYT